MIIDYYQSYLSTIRNSIGSNLWRNFWIQTASGPKDILGNGNLSCGYFVSNVLKQYNLLPSSHANTLTTIEVMRSYGWEEIPQDTPPDDIPVGAVIVRSGVSESTKINTYGSTITTLHIGFYMGDELAISNDSEHFQSGKSTGTPQSHHYTYHDARQILHIFHYPRPDTSTKAIQHLPHGQFHTELEIGLISQTSTELHKEIHQLSTEEISRSTGAREGLKKGRICGLSCMMMAIQYLTGQSIIYKDVIDYRNSSYTFFNPKTQSSETRSIFDSKLGWSHGGLIHIAEQYELKGILQRIENKEELLHNIAYTLDHDVVMICSVGQLSDASNTDTKGHLVVIKGLDYNGYVMTIILHDPVDPMLSVGLGGSPFKIPLDEFIKKFGGNTILISRV